jgi:hypothetical protein
MKHAAPAALLLLLALAGCAPERERAASPEVTYAPAAAHEEQSVRQAARAGQSVSTGSLPAADTGVAIGRALRNERMIYAQGLERILVINGVGASVIVDEDGKAGPTPALMFIGRFSPAFIHRALTEGAVLQRARGLGFRSVDFIDKGPEGNYRFELTRSGPLPKCEVHSRLCL